MKPLEAHLFSGAFLLYTVSDMIYQYSGIHCKYWGYKGYNGKLYL